jgi:hypothetical protein
MPKDGSLLHGHKRVPDTEDHENSEHHKIGMLGCSVVGSRGIDQEGLPMPDLPVNLLRGHRNDQKNSLVSGNSKGFKLADHENIPRFGNSATDHKEGLEGSPCVGSPKTGHRGDQEDSQKFMNAGVLKDGSLGDQESSPGGGDLRGVRTQDHEGSPRITRCDHIGIVESDSEEFIGDDSLGHYEIYVVSPQLKEGLGVALIDTGSQISLIKESSLIKCSKETGENLHITGITGKQMKVKGKMKIRIENALEPVEQACYVVDSLPRKLDIILGQDWLDSAGYGFQRKTPVIIPPYSEQIVKCKTTEKGVRFIEHQITQPGLICASSLVNCENYEFPCLMINLTEEPICMIAEPKLEKPPTMIHKRECGNQINKMKRLQLLNENLRLDHINEGSSEIRNICEEYVDIFKLPGDSLTATTAAEHTIPTPTIPQGRAITLKNYRLPIAQQEEIKRQVTQMLKDEVITHSNSG